MIWLLRLYPRAWQRRYREEVAAQLASERRTIRLFLDLVAGAIDARLNPQWTPQSSPIGGNKMTSTNLHSCARCRFSPSNPVLSAAMMIGLTLLGTALASVLRAQIGESVFGQALLYSAFPTALLITTAEAVRPKPYSRAARTVITTALVGGMYLFFLVVAYFADRL